MIRVISLISLEPLSVVGVWGYICHKGKLAAFLLANKFPHSIFAFIHSHLSLVILSTLSSLILSYSLFPLSCFPSTSPAYAFFTHSLMLSSSLSLPSFFISVYIHYFVSFPLFLFILFLILFQFYSPFSLTHLIIFSHTFNNILPSLRLILSLSLVFISLHLKWFFLDFVWN